MLLCRGPLVRVSPKNSGMEPHPPPEVLALGPAAIRLDFLLPFKEAAGALAAFRLLHSRLHTWNPSPAVRGSICQRGREGAKNSRVQLDGPRGSPTPSPAGTWGPSAGLAGHSHPLVWQKLLLKPHLWFSEMALPTGRPPGRSPLDWPRCCGSWARGSPPFPLPVSKVHRIGQ